MYCLPFGNSIEKNWGYAKKSFYKRKKGVDKLPFHL
jgi:hypothetical protein